MRIYDPRLGRFLSVDPMAGTYAWNSPYAFAENTPIMGVDLEGGELLNKIKAAIKEKIGVENYDKIKKMIDAAASSALIKTAKTIFPGVDKVNEAAKQEQFKTSSDNTVAILLYEFATGKGKQEHTFDYGTHPITKELLQGKVLNEIVGDFTEKIKNITYADFKKNGVKFGLAFSPDQTSSLQESIEKHLNANLSQFFVGGANVAVTATDDEGVFNVTITNNTSRRSLLLHGAGNYERKGGGEGDGLSTITQKFTFSIKVDPSNFKKEEKKE